MISTKYEIIYTACSWMWVIAELKNIQPQNTKITLNLITCLVQKGNDISWILIVFFIPNQNYNVYILCFVSISPRVPKDQEVNQGLQWVYLHLYLFTIDAYAPAWFEISTKYLNFFFFCIIGSTWSTWPKSKSSWFCSFYLSIFFF